MSSTYSPGNRAHRALTRLAQGSATLDGLRALVCAEEPTRKAIKFKWVVRAMAADGLIALTGNTYRITDDGGDALADLDAGRDFRVCGKPNVRIFARKEAVHG